MRYIFKTLILGNIEYTPYFVSNAFIEAGEEKENTLLWYKEINAFEDVCNLEVEVICDMINANFDEILPMVDGIIYFLNPQNNEELEYFDLILPIIDSVKRDIPTVILYYDLDGIIPISTNELLENLWLKYPQLEAFVNVSPREFYQPLQCLCLAMITGDTPLNIENAWMRFPIFILLANLYYEKQNFFYAAQAIRKAAMIADIFNKAEFYIISEQAALLFSKENLYLEASKILQNIDKKKSENFKKLYAESIILEGNKLFNNRDYELAAKQYLTAAQWATIELKDIELRNETFKLAINSWISACKVEYSFKILNSLPHQKVLNILKEIDDKILAAADFLVKSKKLDKAKDQIYKAITVYQREGLFDILDKFTYKQVDILKKLLELQINKNDIYSAKYSYDEIENLWESYGVKKSNLDKLLEELIQLFLNELNFGMATDLMNKLNSLSIKKKLTKIRDKVEEEAKELRRKEIQENLEKGVKVLKEFLDEELKIIASLNEKIIKEANALIESNEFIRAAERIKNQANFLKSIGKEQIQEELLFKSLDTLLIGKAMTQFIPLFTELTELTKERYLIKKFQLILKQLKEIKSERKYSELERIYENLIRIYREQELYEQAQTISEEYIEVIKSRILQILDTENNLQGIERALNLTNKASEISLAYLEKIKIDLNEIYRIIAERYIELGNLSGAHAINDRIDNNAIKAEINKKIEKLEAEKSAIEIKKAEEDFKEESLIERLSLIKKKARDALIDKENELRQRKGYKRAYFEDALLLLKSGEYEGAIKKYEESINRLFNIRQYNLAGVSLAVIALILLKQEKFSLIEPRLKKIKEDYSSLVRLLSETFAITIIEYLIDLNKLHKKFRLKEYVHFFENLPLFKEEETLLYEYLGEKHKAPEKGKEISSTPIEMDVLEEKITQLAKSIQLEKSDIAKRKLMKNQYWRYALEDLSNKKYRTAAMDYIDVVPQLMEKKFYKQASISLIIGCLLMVKENDINVAKSAYYDNLNRLEKYKSNIEDLPEIKLVPELFFAIENDLKKLIETCLNLFIEKLALFTPESEYLKSLIPKETPKEIEKELISREELGKRSIDSVQREQNFANLRQKLPDIKRERNDLLKKRNAMKKYYYKEVTSALEENNLKLTGNLYFDLAMSLSKRKDFTTSSLLILLHGLALIKNNVSLLIIKSNVDQFLNSLGLNKRLVEDTFYIRCINFILDVILNKLDNYISPINEMLEILPLFEEENKLKQIEL
ncbi:MAG: hypothetical protein ACFE8E_06920 [Candidatus Hodarchaeota archaeon]